MRKVYVYDGGVLVADSPEGFVEQLRATTFFPERSLAEYMAAAALRCKVQSGAEVRCANAEQFVDDLQQHGYLQIINLS